MDPAISLFKPGSGSLNFDIANGQEHEENEEAEDLKIKEKELQDLLSTEFDDLIDEDEASSVASEDVLHLQKSIRNPTTKIRQQWPNGKDNETSTPKHQVPPWTIEYTPINVFQQPTNPKQLANGFNEDPQSVKNHPLSNDIYNKYRNTEEPFFAGHNGYANGFDNQKSVVDFNSEGDGKGSKFMLPEQDHSNNIQFNENDSENVLHHQYAEELVRLKETIVRLQEESAQNVRLLRHQLIIAKGEKESLAFSLQQARQLLNDKEKEHYSVNKDISELNKQLDIERNTNEELKHKLEISQSSVVSLQEQLTEMTKFETYTFVKDKQDTVIQNMKSRHQQEMDACRRDLESKEVELERLLQQLQKLERYQEHTLPHKLKGIEQLTRNLETVDDYCQKLLATGAFQDVEKLKYEQSDVNSSKNIQLLLNAINELGTKLPTATDQSNVSRSVLKQLEKENLDLIKELEIIKSESKRDRDEIDHLNKENMKLRSTIQTMIKKHDLDIKSAIEKYHSLHNKETKILQEELSEAADDEKERLRSFYEEKLTTLYLENENLRSSLDEIKNLYIRVCEEKNVLESQIQNMRYQSLDKELLCVGTQTEINEYSESSVEKKIQEELNARILAREKINEKKYEEMNKVLSEYRKTFSSQEEKLQKELLEKNNLVQSLTKQLQSIQVENSHDLKSKIRQLETLLLEEEKKLNSKEEEMEAMRQSFVLEWSERQKQIQSVYNSKMEELGKAQKRELEEIMSDVQKAVANEQSEFLARHSNFVQSLKDDKEMLTKQLNEFIEAKKQHKDASVNVSLTTIKERTLMEQLHKMKLIMEQFKLKQQHEKNERIQNKKNATVQTDEKIFLKKDVVEMCDLYKEIIQKIKEEVELHMTTSGTIAAEHVKSAIILFYNELS